MPNRVNLDNYEQYITDYEFTTSILGDELFSGMDLEEVWQSVMLASNGPELVAALDAKDWLQGVVYDHNKRSKGQQAS